MKKNTLIAIWSILMLFNVSCSKKENGKILIKGAIYDSRSGVYVDNANVNIATKKANQGVYTSAYSSLGSAITNTSGRYEFDFKFEKYVDYRMTIKKENYIEKTEIVSADYTSINVPLLMPTIDLTPSGYYKVRVRSQFPFDETDFMRFDVLNANFNDCDCCRNISFTHVGTNFDTTYKCLSYAQQFLFFQLKTIKNGNETIKIDSIFIASGDTTFVEVLF